MNEAASEQQQLDTLDGKEADTLPAKRQAILVLGMHRSGTSAVSGVVEALGAAAPKTAPPPDKWNPRGYFESKLLFPALDAMLASAGSAWDDWRQLDPQWFASEAARHHRQRLKRLLIDEFGDERLIVVKDGRMCRFVPFISSILAELNISPVAVLPVRNPLEVAYSLRRRDGFTLSKSILLWLRHVLDAELHSRQLPRCFLSYEDFLLDWRRQMERVVEKIGIAWPAPSGSTAVAVDQFLTRDLHRERASLDEFNTHPEITPWARETYGILTKIAAGGESTPLLEQLDAVRTRFDEACGAFAPLVADATEAQRRPASERDGLRSEHDRLAAAYESLRAAPRSAHPESVYDDKTKIAAAVSAGRHREIVGGMWDEIGALQFEFLKGHGLSTQDHLLDIGCGSLRGGVHFAAYLQPGHYWGVDSHEDLLDAGYRIELNRLGLTDRVPRANLLHDGDFNFERFDRMFDVAIAQSLFTHLSASRIHLCLYRLAKVMVPGGRLFATYFEIPEGYGADQSYWHVQGDVLSFGYKDPFHYRRSELTAMASGLAWRIVWSGDWKHPRDQKMMIFERLAEAPSDERDSPAPPGR